MLAVKNSSVRLAAAGVGVKRAGRLTKLEIVETDVPALTGSSSGSKRSGLATAIATPIVGPLDRDLFGVFKGLAGPLVVPGIQHQGADLVVWWRAVAHSGVKQARGQLLAAAQELPALVVEGFHLVHFFLAVKYLHS